MLNRKKYLYGKGHFMKEIILDICSIKIKFEFEFDIHKSVFAKYESFISEESSFDYLINICYKYEVDSSGSDAEPSYEISEGIIHIEKPDLSGSFDLSKGKGFFTIFPNIHSLDSFLRVFFSVFLIIELDGFLLHSSSIKRDDSAYIFTGESGSGKSTIAELGDNFTILSDEIVAIRKFRGSYYSFGTPFMSKFAFGGVNDRALIRSVYFLNKHENNKKIILKPGSALNRLMPNILFFGKEKSLHARLLALAHDLVTKVAFYDLYFKKDRSVFDIV